jgi:hypothetical protein
MRKNPHDLCDSQLHPKLTSRQAQLA